MIKTPNPQWPPDTTGAFTASERRLFAPIGKTVSAGPVGWTAKERRAFCALSKKRAKRSAKAKRC